MQLPEPMQVLYEADNLPLYGIPNDLRRFYGGDLGFPDRRLYTNFVSSIDGVVALDGGGPSGSIISGNSLHDRFVMGLLRACADAVLVGAGTLRAERDHLWTPEFICPDWAVAFARLRQQLGRARQPTLVLVTATGEIDVSAPAIERGALILTTAAGASRLRSKLPRTSSVSVLGETGRLDPADVLSAIQAEGHRVVLTEGGPHLTGSLVASGLLDELFLTLSPLPAGRDNRHRRLGLLEGVMLLPASVLTAKLAGVRRARSMLFLRYELSGL